MRLVAAVECGCRCGRMKKPWTPRRWGCRPMRKYLPSVAPMNHDRDRRNSWPDFVGSFVDGFQEIGPHWRGWTCRGVAQDFYADLIRRLLLFCSMVVT